MTVTPSPTPVLVPAPLTGRLVSPALAARHPVAVMIDDQADARPQSGFNQASVVWQAPAEGGIPRYMLIFGEGNPPAVGPVRSSRLYFITWAAEWRAVYVHVGGSPQALSALAASGAGQLVYNADEFQYGGTFLWRITQRFAPHNVYTDGKHLRGLAARVGATAPPVGPVWKFGPGAPLADRLVGGSLAITYPANRISYRYDRASNTYRQFVGGAPQIDAGDGRQVAPVNVVVMTVVFGPLNDGHPEKKRLEAQNVGSGPAWIATNGVTIHGTWRKTSTTAATRFYDDAGRQVKLTAGQTFIQVVPPGTPVKIVAGTPARRRVARRRRVTRRGIAASLDPLRAGRDGRRVCLARPQRDVRPRSAPRRRALGGGGRDRAVDALLGPGRAQGCSEAVRVARRYQQPSRSNGFGDRPDGAADDRRPHRQRVQNRQRRGIREHGVEGGARACPQELDPVGRQAGRKRERIPDARLERLAGKRSTVVRGGAQDEDPGWPGRGPRQPRRAAGRGQTAKRRQERPNVLPRVVAASIDEVPLRQAEPIALGREACPRRIALRGPSRLERTERIIAGERHDAHPVGAQAEEASGGSRDRFTADQHARRIAQELRAKALAEASGGRPLVLLGELPRRKVEQRGDDRQARTDRERAGDGMRHDPGGAVRGGTPPRTEARSSDEERVEGQRSRAEDPGRRKSASPGERETGELGGGIVRAEIEERDEGFAGQRRRGVGGQEPAQVGGGHRRALRVLERAHVEQDAGTGRVGRDRAAAEPHRERRGPRPRSSSRRSWQTTTSASTMMRRLILDWPIRRSRNVIGTSRMRAPRRFAR